MKALPKTPAPPREQLPRPKTYILDRRKTLIVIFPRITEWLKRKELIARANIPTHAVTNVIYWIKKQNRYQIQQGTFDDELLDICEDFVKSIPYESTQFEDHGLFWSTLPNE